MILAIDTSTEWVGLALFDTCQVLSENIWRSKNYHTVELVPAIASMLAHVQATPQELTGLAVALGPGSFTGLRIGLSVAKGLALPNNLPIIGIPSLDLLAQAQSPMRRPLITILPLGRQRYAYQRYLCQKEEWIAQGEVQVDDLRGIAATITSPVYIVGEMNAEARQILGRKWKTARLAPPAQCLRRPSVLAQLAWERIQKGERHNAAGLAPIYVHTLSNVPKV